MLQKYLGLLFSVVLSLVQNAIQNPEGFCFVLFSKFMFTFSLFEFTSRYKMQ